MGKPTLPPTPPEQYEEHIEGMYQGGYIVDGDILEVWLYQVEDYLDNIHELRGDPEASRP